MKNIFHKSLALKIFSAVFSLMFLTCISANAQDTEDRIINTVPKTVPLKIEILNAGTDDFFNDLRIKVTNTGDKPIYSLRLVLLVPNSKSPIGESAIFFRYGRMELWFDKVEIPTEKDPSIQPDESYTFKIDKQTVKIYTKLFSEGSLSSTINSRLEFTELRYGDRTGYTRRGYFKKKL